MTSPVSAPTPPENESRPLFIRREAVWLTLVLVLAGVVRLGSLHLLPSFIDESAHIWAATNYTDYPLAMRARIGKVLGYILFYPTARFCSDPLFATRVLMAVVGVLTVLGIYMAVRRMGGRIAAVLAAGIWALMPFVTFHDRMALHDPLISLFLTWAMVLTVRFLQENDRRILPLAGLLVGLGIATKLTTLMALVWFVLIAAAYVTVSGLGKHFRTALLFAAGAAGPLLLFLPGTRQFLTDRGQLLATEADQIPRGQLIVTNVGKIITWITTYDSAAFTLFCGLVLILAVRNRSRIKTALLLCFLLACAAYTPLFRVWFPRYFLPALLPLVMLSGIVAADCIAAAGAAWRNRKAAPNMAPLGIAALLVGLLAISTISWAGANWRFQTDPHSVQLPEEDRFQYLDGWPSGTGVRELAAFLNRMAQQSTGETLVLYGGIYGRHMPWSIPLYVKPNPHVTFRNHLIGSRPDFWRTVLESVRQPTYLVLEPPIYELPPDLSALITPPLRPVFEFKRPSAPGGFIVYRLERSTYLRMPSPPPATAGDTAKIADVANTNGMEKMETDPFTWLGQDYLMLRVEAPKPGRVELETTLYPGPSISGTSERHLLVKSSSGFTREVISSGGKTVIGLPVAAGPNEIMFGALDRPNVPALPNGDTRQLILGLRALQIARFQEGGDTGAGSEPLAAICAAAFGSGWHGRENFGKDWIRWNSGTSQVIVASQTEATAVLRGGLFSMPRPNRVDLYLRGQKLASWDIRGETYQPTGNVALPLQSGENVLEFVSAQPAASVPGDNRKLAIAVRNLEISGAKAGDGCKLNP